MSIIGLIEIPKGSTFKYELDKETGRLQIDRVVKQYYPENYGFIPGTLSEDGDELDIFVYGQFPIAPLTQVKLDIVGVIEMVDGGELDEKLICRIEGQTHHFNSDFGDIVYFLKNYKDGISITAVAGKERALDILKEARERYSKS